MAIKVITSDKLWAGFIRRAKKAFPKEHVEALWGEQTVDSYRITDFKRIKTDKNTSNSIEYDETEVKRQKWLAHKAGKSFLGTAHTHPRADLDVSPSQTDHHEGASDGEKIMGIVVIYKDKNTSRFVTETEWWFPQPKIEFEVLPE